MEDKKPFSNFVDGIHVYSREAMYLCCDICGEWLQWEAKIEYDPKTESQHLVIKSGSCGETFYLVPDGFHTIKDEQSLYTPSKQSQPKT